MGRRKKKSDVGMDLFSFLNIMTATIGVQTLTLVIFALQIKPGVKAVQLLPAGGTGKGKTGNYIICNKGGELDMLVGSERMAANINDDKIDSIIEGLNKKESPQYLVIGVRPSAFRDFESVRSKAEARRLVIGYEPLEKDLKVIVPGAPETATGGSAS